MDAKSETAWLAMQAWFSNGQLTGWLDGQTDLRRKGRWVTTRTQLWRVLPNKFADLGLNSNIYIISCSAEVTAKLLSGQTARGWLMAGPPCKPSNDGTSEAIKRFWMRVVKEEEGKYGSFIRH